MAFRARKLFGTFKKRAPGLLMCLYSIRYSAREASLNGAVTASRAKPRDSLIVLHVPQVTCFLGKRYPYAEIWVLGIIPNILSPP